MGKASRKKRERKTDYPFIVDEAQIDSTFKRLCPDGKLTWAYLKYIRGFFADEMKDGPFQKEPQIYNEKC